MFPQCGIFSQLQKFSRVGRGPSTDQVLLHVVLSVLFTLDPRCVVSRGQHGDMADSSSLYPLWAMPVAPLASWGPQMVAPSEQGPWRSRAVGLAVRVRATGDLHDSTCLLPPWHPGVVSV